MDDLILKYISLDYHELLMAASGDNSESALESILHNDSRKYVLIVQGAVPLGMDGKFLRIGHRNRVRVDAADREGN